MQQIHVYIKSEMNVKVLIDPRTGATTAVENDGQTHSQQIQINQGPMQTGISLSNKLFGNIGNKNNCNEFERASTMMHQNSKELQENSKATGKSLFGTLFKKPQSDNSTGPSDLKQKSQQNQESGGIIQFNQPNFGLSFLQQIQTKAKEIVKSHKYDKYDPKSLFCFKRESKFRHSIIWLINQKKFDYFIICVIFANSICLAVYDYSDQNSMTARNKILDIFDYIFTGIYTTECLLKIVGMGFCLKKNSYLRDSWNILDFIVVVIGLISTLPNIPSLKGLRTLRVLRPLRSIKAVPSMKRLVGSLLLSLPQMANVVMFLLFVFMVFGILGIQTFQGAQYNRCRTMQQPLPSGIWPIDESQDRLCGGLYSCNQGTYCGQLSQFGLDVSLDNVTSSALINYNINNFDNIFLGLLTIFQCMTLEGWTGHMYNYMDGSGWFAFIYFPIMILIGSIFLLNLFLAVIMKIFTEMDERQKEIERERKRKENILLGIKEESSLFDRLKIGVQHINKNKKKKQPNMKSILKDYKQLHQEKYENEKDENDNKSDLKQKAELNQTIATVDIFHGDLENPNYFTKIRYLLFKVCTHKIFQLSINLFIILNTVCLSLDKYPQDQALVNKLDSLNIAFTVIFFLEMIIKLFGIGIKGYFKDKLSIFDGFIVLLSIIDVIVNYSLQNDGQSGKGAISAFRAFRLLRIFKLAKSWGKFQELLRTILNSLKDISSFSVLLFLFMFTYVLLGLELFAFQVQFNDNNQLDLVNGTSPRINFDNFFNALITIFIVLTGENWDQIMYDFARAKGALAILFFVSFIVLGQMILLNLFLAILLKNFDESSIVERKNASELLKNQENKEESKFQKFLREKIDSINCRRTKRDKNIYKIQENNPHENNEEHKSQEQVKQTQILQTQDKEEIKIEYFGRHNLNKQDSSQKILDDLRLSSNRNNLKVDIEDSFDMSKEEQQIIDFNEAEKEKLNKALNIFKHPPFDHKNFFHSHEHASQTDLYKRGHSIANIITAKMKETKSDHSNGTQYGYSIFLFDGENKIRRIVSKIITNPYFDYVVLVVICIQSLLLAFDNPLNDPNGILVEILYYADIIFTSIFVVELILKIIAFGLLINGPSSYLRNLWNIADFTIVIISLLSLFYTNQKFHSIKAIRMLRVLRPLRIISRNQGLKVAVSALLMALPNIINVIIISVLFYIIFGIIGVNYFKGTFYYCYYDSDIYDQTLQKKIDDTVMSKFDCQNYGGIWINHDQNFDNIIQAISTFYQISTPQGWVKVMFMGEDSVAIDMQPKMYNNGYWNLFFIFFIIVGNFFVLNLFVGVVISTFNREKEVLGKNFLLTGQQKQWLEQKKLCMQIQPKVLSNLKHENIFREMIRVLVISYAFEIFILVVIVLNTIVLMITWYNQDQYSVTILNDINYIFAGIFTLEALLKMIGLGFKKYFIDKWNQFDFIVVIGTLISIIITALTSVQIGAATTFIRAFKISRILKLIKRARRLKVIFETFIVTIPALTNVGGLLVLFLYIYSILGIQLFATIKLQNDLDVNANFQTFGRAFLTLIRCATGEAWNAIMMDTIRDRTAIFDCNEADFDYDSYVAGGWQTEGCGTNMGYFFFCSYYLVVPLIFLNLFIAIILQGFEDMNQKEMILIKEEHMEQFRDAWAKYDPEGTGFINIQKLPSFLFDLGVPLGWDAETYKDNLEKQDDFLEEMNISTYNDFKDYLFWDVLQSLTKVFIVLQGAEGKLKSQAQFSSFSNSYQQQPSFNGELGENQNNSRHPNVEGRDNFEGDVFSSMQKFERKVKIRLELEFEHYDQQKSDVLAVQDLKKREQHIKKSLGLKEDNHLTSAHIKAGRKIFYALQRLKKKADLVIEKRKSVSGQ